MDGLADEPRSIADDAGRIATVTDESGTILWTCGGRVMLRRAERVNFAPGGRWDEAAMGTNALSLALCTGRPPACSPSSTWSRRCTAGSAAAHRSATPTAGSWGVLDLSST
ncbi:hypothetical protein [Streptomyces sp. NPDC056165]|uniref:hypothetical protein n=1 Tax=Streptomyces sp. NPDC056165 TaxID=3345733 RepID=UPI0035D5F226